MTSAQEFVEITLSVDRSEKTILNYLQVRFVCVYNFERFINH